VFHFGSLSVQNASMSRMMRIAGRGGQIHSFCAMNSFRISFCSVPPIWSYGTPRFSATATYNASSTIAGALMVMDVVTALWSMPAKSASMS